VSELGDMGQEWLEHLRIAILRALTVAPGYSLNESILHTYLTGPKLRFKVTRDRVRRQIEWLATERLVTAEDAGDDGELLVATLTMRGLDVAQGNDRHRGVKNPSPKG